MNTVDITPTPEACRQIARLFTAQKADAEALAARAARAAAFAALSEASSARAFKMQEGLEALGPYADADRWGGLRRCSLTPMTPRVARSNARRSIGSGARNSPRPGTSGKPSPTPAC